MTRVKICGIRDVAALEAAAGADWVGFVFFPPSPRAVTPAEAAAISAAQPGGPDRVGLFVDPTDAEIETVLDAIPLHVLQIVADPARCAEIRTHFARPVWRAVGIATRDDLPGGEAVDAWLLDAKPPSGATRPGGNAVSFDWALLRDWAPSRPYVLAGGLTPETVAAAIATSGAHAVDVSSGVERARGVKDPALIRAFIANARAA